MDVGNRDNGNNDDIIEMGLLSQKLFQDSFKSVIDVDIDLANHVMRNSRMSTALGNKMIQRSEHNEKSYCLSGERQRKIVESFQRISEYSADIAEMVINMKATHIKQSFSEEAKALEQA
jgi:hypothetical protein